ncbi:MAG TPA: hypothetical protein VGF67_33210 [Ktedonobacteraceae bacterium]|jgi:hypothetical protein
MPANVFSHSFRLAQVIDHASDGVGSAMFEHRQTAVKHRGRQRHLAYGESLSEPGQVVHLPAEHPEFAP